MTLAVPSDYANCHVNFACAGSSHQMSTALGFFMGGTGLGPTLTAFIAAWEDHMSGGALSDQYTITSYVGENVASLIEIPATTVGSASAAHISANTSVLVKKVTGQRGKGQTGRMFLPGGYLPEGLVDAAGVLSGALVSDIQDNVDAVLADMVTAGTTPVLFHDDTSPLAATPTNLIQVVVQDVAATQRRRMR